MFLVKQNAPRGIALAAERKMSLFATPPQADIPAEQDSFYLTGNRRKVSGRRAGCSTRQEEPNERKAGICGEKPEYAVKAKELREEIENYLGISTVTGVRVLIRYDMENLSDEVYQASLGTIFSEPPVDDCYETVFPKNEGDTVFSVEYLPGQFDQRADSAEQCVKLLNENEEPVIRTATTYVISGELTAEQTAAIKSFCINPVDSGEASEEIPATLVTEFETPEDVKILDGFCALGKEELEELYRSFNLAMTFKDFEHIQNYYIREEKRDPSVTEIRVLDTYWSDHCRHTTFSTELKSVSFTDGDYRKPIEDTYRQYLADREEV